MHRRDLLKGAAALSLAPAVGGGTGAAAKAGVAVSRVRPSDPAWPTQAQWAGLKRSLSGELLTPKPLLAACDAPGDAACRDALKHLGNPFFIGDQASGTQVSGYLDAWTSAPSAYAVAARDQRRRGRGGRTSRATHNCGWSSRAAATATRARRTRRIRCWSGRGA